MPGTMRGMTLTSAGSGLAVRVRVCADVIVSLHQRTDQDIRGHSRCAAVV